MNDLKAKIPAAGKLSDNPRVKNSLKQLDEVAEQLAK